MSEVIEELKKENQRLREENEQIRQNSVSHETFILLMQEKDKEIANLKHKKY